jgi:phage terminase large subunit
LQIEFNERLAFLFKPARLKISYGGRGGGKTDGYAIALIILSMQRKLRILCLREIQNSIEESVKETIESYIALYELEWAFDIKDKSITCNLTGSRFIFSGLRYKINSIKSLAKIDIAWVEEANNASKTSWDKLMPTIRGKHESSPDGLGGPFGLGPEIWISFNPELDDDETYDRYIIKKEQYAPDWIPSEVPEVEQTWFRTVEEKLKTGNIILKEDEQAKFNEIENKRYAYVVKINYYDNKWFPPDLRREMELLKTHQPVKYLEIYEGYTKQTLDGAIYADELQQVLLDGRRKKVLYDPFKPVYTFWDLGHSDRTAIWFIQRVGMEYNVINYYENRLKKLPHYLEHMKSLGYNYGTVYQPHDADNETLASRSIASLTRAAGYKVIVVNRPSKKAVGINAVRTVMELCNFDEENTKDGWQCLSRYAYKVNEETGNFSREPDHDTPWSHGADGFQTFALSLKTEDDTKKKKPKPKYVIPNQPRAWMG